MYKAAATANFNWWENCALVENSQTCAITSASFAFAQLCLPPLSQSFLVGLVSGSPSATISCRLLLSSSVAQAFPVSYMLTPLQNHYLPHHRYRSRYYPHRQGPNPYLVECLRMNRRGERHVEINHRLWKFGCCWTGWNENREASCGHHRRGGSRHRRGAGSFSCGCSSCQTADWSFWRAPPSTPKGWACPMLVADTPVVPALLGEKDCPRGQTCFLRGLPLRSSDCPSADCAAGLSKCPAQKCPLSRIPCPCPLLLYASVADCLLSAPCSQDWAFPCRVMKAACQFAVLLRPCLRHFCWLRVFQKSRELWLIHIHSVCSHAQRKAL